MFELTTLDEGDKVFSTIDGTVAVVRKVNGIRFLETDKYMWPLIQFKSSNFERYFGDLKPGEHLDLSKIGVMDK